MHAVSADVQESGLLCEYGESLCENHGLYVKELCAQSRFWGCSARVLGEHKLNSIKAPDQVVWNSGQKWVICVRRGLGQRACDACLRAIEFMFFDIAHDNQTYVDPIPFPLVCLDNDAL